MAKARPSAKPRARAPRQPRSQDRSAIVAARYDPRRDAVDLGFAGGGTITIPRQLIRGLEGTTPRVLASVDLVPAGDALSWRSPLDLDVDVPGLIERAFGSRLFAAATGRRGGRRRSRSKAAAARANGTKGGRPRKRIATSMGATTS